MKVRSNPNPTHLFLFQTAKVLMQSITEEAFLGDNGTTAATDLLSATYGPIKDNPAFPALILAGPKFL